METNFVKLMYSYIHSRIDPSVYIYWKTILFKFTTISAFAFSILLYPIYPSIKFLY